MNITSILTDLRQRNIVVRVKGNDLSVVAEKGVLSPETREILVNHKQAIVSYLRRLEQTETQVSLLTEAEQQQLLVEWNRTAGEYPKETIVELFGLQAGKTAEAVALQYEGKSLTYAELDEKTNQLAHYLQKLGVGPEMRVGICMERSLEMVVALLGVLKAGAAYVPLDPGYPQERLQFFADDSQVAALITQRALENRFSKNQSRLIFLEDVREEIEQYSREKVESRIRTENLAYLIYTSGSTGKPKGVMVTHGNVVRLMRATERWFGFNEQDVWTMFHSYAFDFSVWELWGALLYGGRLEVIPYWVSRSPEAFYRLVMERGVTVLNQTPSAFQQFSQEDASNQRAGEELKLRLVIFGGEALEMSSLRPWFERHGDTKPQMVNMYGITETTVHVTYKGLTKKTAQGNASVIGERISDLQVYILHDMQPVPVGVAGEMYIGGAGLARGYWNRAELTAERFVPHPFSEGKGERLYRTGDLGRYLADGGIEYLGRIDQQVKIRGHRIELGEIEAALEEHETVRQAVVMAREDQPGEKRLVAYVVREQGCEELDVSRMRGYLHTRLPEYMVPAALVVLERMPLTANGKLDRKALPRPEWKADEKKYVTPRNAVEEALSRIWGDVLGVKRVGIRDNFFELGGDSIISIQILARCRAAGLKLELRQLFQQQTIERLAPLVGGVEEEEESGGEPFSLISAEDRSRLPEDVEDAYPLSRLQMGMLFHNEYSEKAPLYYDINSFHLRAPLDAEVLRRAVAEVVERHEVLRTSFHISGYSQPVQCVHRTAEIEVEVEDLRHLGAEEQKEILKEWMEAEKRRGFDVSCAGLLRFHVHRRTEETFQFWLTHHHVILDGWSRASMFTELFGCYFGLLKGGWEKKKKLSRRFREFIEAEMEVVKSEEARGFWAEQLRGMEIATVPWEKQRKPNVEKRTLMAPIEAETSEALSGWARQMGVSLKSVLLAAHVRVLSLISGQTDVVTGITSEGRMERGEGEQVLGLFLNSPPFRMTLRGGSWKDLVQQTAAQEAALLPYRRYPLAEIQRLAGRTSLFDVTFNFVHFHIYREIERVGGIEVLSGEPFGLTSFTLSADFNLDPVLSTLLLMLEYNSLLVTKEQIQSIGGYYQNVLKQMVRYPDARYEFTSLLSDSERQQLLVEWNKTAVEYPRESVVELFERQADKTPQAVAVEFADRQLTYAELNARANQLARYLEKLEVGPETTAGLCMERSLEMFVALLGIMKAGAVYVPLDPQYPADRLAFMAEDAALKLTLIHNMTANVTPQSVGRIVNLSRDTELISQEPDSNLSVKDHPENLAYIIYTSGSTGKPKGVGISYGALCNQLCWATRALQLSATDRFLQKGSLSFDASFEEIFTPLLAGARIVATKPGGEHDVEYLAKLVASQDVTCIDVNPSLLRAFLDYPDATVWRSVRLVTCGGEALKPELVKLFHTRFSGTLINVYGPTEAAVQCSWADNLQPAESVPIGRPVANTTLFVLDEHFEPVPVGAAGELFIGGAGVARGYINHPALTAERFMPDPFSASGGERLYSTGDLVKWRNDGQLYFVGRLDYQVKLRGYRIELGEIEKAIESHPQVKQAVVVVREDQPGVPRLVGYVVRVAEGPTFNIAALREYLKKRLPDYMVPAAWVEMKEFPLTPTGKIDRKALPAPELQLVQAEHVRPRNATEEILAGLWESVLKQDQVSVEADFLDLGGHSLVAMQLIARIRKAFSVEMPLRVLFEKPTVTGLAGWIEREKLSTKQESIPAIRRDEKRQPAPLSFAQQRLWFIDRFMPNSPTYNISDALQLQGSLNLKALEWVMTEVVRRHQVLRTHMEVVEGQPRQVIAPAAPVPILIHDLSLLNPQDQETEVKIQMREEAETPFDLGRGPLLRIKLLRLGEKAHVLLVSTHHIVSDLWSTNIMVRELTQFYEGYVLGKDSALPELPIQYADYAVWQRQWLQGEVLERQVAYWRNQLAEAPALEMPTDFPRGVMESEAGASLKWELSGELSGKIRELARREDTTLFMTLLAAFQLLLSRYSRQSDIAVGSPIAGRTQAEIEPLIGFFVNTLVLRTDLSGRPTFAELLRRVRETALSAYAHQDVPFEKLVEELQPERDLSRSPLFQTMFMLQNTPTVELELPGLKLSVMERVVKNVHFELLLSASEEKGKIGGGLSYRTGLFSESRIRRMLGHWQNLLESIVTGPQKRIGELGMLSKAERRQVLEEWNRTEVKYRHICVHRMVEEHAAKTPTAVAVEYEDQRLSYAELNQRANQLAHHLRKMGAGTEALVGICVERSLEMTIGVLAILKTGAAYVPLDPKYPDRRLSYMLENSHIELLVTQEKFHSMFTGLVNSMICMDKDWQSIAEESQANLDVDVDSGNIAFVIHTSGSTGRPKGVAMHHGAAANLVHWHLQQDSGMQPPVTLQFASLSFDVSFQEIFATWCAGGRLVLIGEDARRDPFELWRTLCDEGITRISLPFVALSQLAEAALRTKHRADSLRELISAGEQLRTTPALKKLLNEMPHCILENQYGPSETHVATVHQLGKDPGHWPLLPPIGKPRANTQVYLLNEEYLPVPAGVAGEIYLGGLQVSRGYVNRPELTAEHFVPNLFNKNPGERLYKTGDLARYLEDGNIEYMGRIDHQVKVRGYRIELGEVESALNECEQVKQAVAAIREDRSGEKRLVGYVVSHDGQELSETALRSELKQRLPEFMVPATLVVVEKLPLTPSGKVDRKRLPDSGRKAGIEEQYVSPRNITEEIICGIWEELLKREPIGVARNFFELGGHSLLATQVVTRISDALHVDLPVRKLFEAPTIAELAHVIEPLRAAGDIEKIPPIVPVPHNQAIPLSFAQQRLWFLDQLQPGSAAYNIPLALRVTGSVRIDLLERVFAQLVTRHEVLRTTFSVEEGQPVQVVAPAHAISVLVKDLSEFPAETREAVARCLAQEEAEMPFDLGRGPLLRVKMLRLAEQDHVLLVTMHHIITDGWSTGIMVREFSQLYQAYSKGNESFSLPELPIQYADFSVWQREWLQGTILQKQLQYWKQSLAGIQTLELPTDRQRPAVMSHAGGIAGFSVGSQQMEDLKAMSRRQGTTLYMTLLAVFQTLLHRYSGQQDIAVGSPIAGRTRPETERLIGFFVNTLVMRTAVSGESTFAELLRRVRQVSLEAYSHQDVPFEKVVEELQPERDLSRTPLFQVMFILQNMPEAKLQVADVTLNAFNVDSQTEKFDLTLAFSEASGQLQGWLSYNAELFEPAMVSRMIGHYRRLLQGIVEHPEQALGKLPMMTEGERQQLLVEWNNTTAEYPQDLIHEMFEQQAAKTPSSIAVECGGLRFTYSELNGRANQLARYLRRLGVGAEVRVGICMERSLEMVAGLLSILKAGAAYVPLDPEYPADRLSFMSAEAKVPVILIQGKFVAGLANCTATLVKVDQESERISQESTGNLEIVVEPENLAYVIYTSGSTGRPKGAMNTHHGLRNRILWMQEKYQLRQDDRVLQKTPYSFDVSVWEFFWPLAMGAGLVVAQPGGHRDPQYLGNLIRQKKVSTLHFVPSMLAAFLEAGAAQQCESVRRVICSGEALSPELARRCMEEVTAELHNLYGPTEASIDVTCYQCTAEEIKNGVPIGKPIANTEIYILDNFGHPVPVLVAGELYIGGAGLARGYVNRPNLTAERFVPDHVSGRRGARLYRTGDKARWRAEGNVEYLGRLDNQVKIRGHRIELEEIEAVLEEQPGIRQAVVLVREDQPGEKWLVAYVVAQGETSADKLQHALKQRVPEYMVPGAFVMLEEMPLTPNGKINRKALPAPAKDRAAARAGYLAPCTTEEEALAKIWCEVLRLERVGVNDNFFELGGHSLLTFRLKTIIKNRLNCDLPLSALFQAPTIGGLVKFLEAPSEKPSSSVLVPIQANGSKNPLFCMHPVGGQIMCYAGLSRELGTDQPFYALQSPDGSATQARTIEEMAMLYIREIQHVQPHGPYLLGGWSMGGLLAFEMAHQLLDAGEKIGLLVLFDSAPPAGTAGTRNGRSRVSMLKHFAWDIGRMVLNNPDELREQFLRTAPEERMKLVLDVLVREEVLPEGSGESELDRLLEIFTRNSLALNSYRPRPIHQRIVLFPAASGQAPEQLAAQWSSLTTVGLEVYPVSGDHYTILKPPHVSEITSLLAHHLELMRVATLSS